MPPFACLTPLPPRSALRARITAACRQPEAACLAGLLPVATLPPETSRQASALATRLVTALRAKGQRGAVEGLVQEYALSSQEGVALMCLAEALLRIPDSATRDALIRDKVGSGDWRRHVGQSPSLFVNAATWGLVVTGKLVGTADETGLAQALTRLLAKGGEPLIRKGIDMAMRLLGEQFVTGQTIAEALARARPLEARGFRYSYDMLGEAATTAEDATRYAAAYEAAIRAIGQAAAGRGPYEGPGISIKLSALHPRYSRAQQDRVMNELLPRLLGLARLARRHDIGLNIDAEEADRLELSLDLLEALCLDPQLAGWNGIGFVVQAYQKRAPHVLDWLVDLARRTGHRLMVRLVKGAYWDSEIKRAQLDGLADFPVFTRKPHTDVSYLACANKLLAAPDAVFPQFATHNAATLAAIHSLAGPDFHPGQYEFQCLHGMGEPLYEEVVGPAKLDRPCRIYAPVGTHETLLAYLVRRLLENGANSSFVNRVQDPKVAVAELAADPAEQVAAMPTPGAPHPRIARPPELFAPDRQNSTGHDLADEATLASLAEALRDSATQDWRAAPPGPAAGPWQPGRNPADARDLVGQAAWATPAEVEAALARAAAAPWQATPPAARAACLQRAAALMEARRVPLLGLLVREAGKTLGNAVAELREAVDFLRYYASQAARDFDNATHVALGPVACISPWNFPLAIFTGQVAAALAAGNPVLAKPAEETPLIAAQAVALLHEAGVPPDALQLLPGDGAVGAQLVGDARIHGVVFTGSTEVARLIARQLAQRLNPDGRPVPLIAETGGQNAMVVDSSALAEQVVGDVIASAFDSAGQRCSALRVLCLQEEVADRVLAILRGAMAELTIGNPDRLATDIGPVITAAARDGILAHVAAMRDAGCAVHQAALPPGCETGSFVPPTIIELDDLSRLTGEIFGPVLHVLRWRRQDQARLMQAINATGYALTFGTHSRIDETIAQLTRQSAAGNVYVNRNMVGAVVGVQPFGGHGLSGTGPKAGGPLYLRRLLARCPQPLGLAPGEVPAAAQAWRDWLAARDAAAAARLVRLHAAPPAAIDLPGPVGERNLYTLLPRGRVLCLGGTEPGAIWAQLDAALLAGNIALLGPGIAVPERLPPALSERVRPAAAGEEAAAVLAEGNVARLAPIQAALAARPGPILPLVVPDAAGAYPLDLLLRERSVSTNLAAAGGNASLMMLG
ncbi:trifunctional transcriptional regulator/proline dehydrogenase/L-glutamate gamma-semialdehyde dehydrogenase [Falsiroseomonas sp.]|uniref:trifunctional transcriptional regulator/proline dehydrogenase/L-glutamate gamma-semialdehyde dehydrogenase n=1 Tax=Falsiroseomonas sp. TaxID=2870721 RepID=UPI003F71379C